jgi:hypothetical protein
MQEPGESLEEEVTWTVDRLILAFGTKQCQMKEGWFGRCGPQNLNFKATLVRQPVTGLFRAPQPPIHLAALLALLTTRVDGSPPPEAVRNVRLVNVRRRPATVQGAPFLPPSRYSR